MCTQIYGGPETATVEGLIDGRPIRTTVTRSDGCGIADWELLTPAPRPARRLTSDVQGGRGSGSSR